MRFWAAAAAPLKWRASSCRLMSDCEETDVFWEFLFSPGKRKRKRKNSQKTQKCVKHKNHINAKTNESNYDDTNKKKKKKKKKEKNPKYKEAMKERKAKKKEWTKGKNKKKKAPVELDNSFIFTQGFSGESGPAAKPEPETSHPEKPKPDRVEMKTKRKKVAFDLAPRYIAVKRPKFVQSAPKENEAAKDGESHCQSQPNDSQCTSDDINSQDLFITQKTFRTQEPSSGEAPDETPPPIARPLPDGSDVQQHLKKEKEQRPTTAPKEEEEEEERWFFTQKESFPRQTESNSNPRGANPFLDDPVVVISSLDVSKSSQQSPPLCLLHSDEASPPPRRTSESTTSSTQTENFFTTELSSYLGFCQKSQRVEDVERVEPLDLSLPLRARNNLGRGVEIGHEGPGRRPSCSSDSKEAEVKQEEEPPGRERCSVRLQGKQGKRTPSPQSESADTTTSSEDYDGPGKLDLTQVRAVQMRLNESFFFKTKGNGPSQRPASPLMKLAQGREVKGRKGHHHHHDHQRS